MKYFLRTTVVVIGLALTATSSFAQITNIYISNPNAIIPGGNPAGTSDAITIAGLTGSIINIQVSLNLTAAYNGSLYAYLLSPGGTKAILLNRPGVNGSDAFGFADAGFNITLDDIGANGGNIHNYGFGSYSTNVAGQVIGIWGSDGRNIDPQSAPATFGTTPPTANLTQYIGDTATGTWTLFVADVTAGDANGSLTGWGLTITTTAVPEPSVLGLSAAGAAFCALIRRRTKLNAD